MKYNLLIFDVIEKRSSHFIQQFSQWIGFRPRNYSVNFHDDKIISETMDPSIHLLNCFYQLNFHQNEQKNQKCAEKPAKNGRKRKDFHASY